MKRFELLRDLCLAAAATIVACGLAVAFNPYAHPDDTQAVYRALTSYELGSVTVDQDRGKGIIKLNGIVSSDDLRDRAQQLARQAAPGYSIDNEIRVDQTDLINLPSTPR